MFTKKSAIACMLGVLAGLLTIQSALAQTFSSGSTSSDGPLAFPNAKSGDVIIFDPNSFSPPLNPAHDNVFNFTTITIQAGVTVKLQSTVLPAGPVTWLASGAVTIAGTLDLSGAAGHPDTNPAISSVRQPAAPGPGGYAGGVGGNGTTFMAEAGLGPGGGSPSQTANNRGDGAGGAFTGNAFLVPLFGGSGGGGVSCCAPGFGRGGGGGGGAILLASSASITLTGAISANGGSGGGFCGSIAGGGGSGGAVRLVAPILQGTGTLSVVGGPNLVSCGNGENNGGLAGRIRLEAYQENFTGTINGQVSAGTPYNTFVPAAPPRLSVTSVGGVAVTPNPTGSFVVPDVLINTTGPVAIAIQASNVPTGTIVNLQFYCENGPDLAVTSSPLSGTMAASTATAQVTLPAGYSRGFVFASFASQ